MTPARAAIIVLALFVAYAASGWRTVSDATRDEEVKFQLKAMDRDSFKLQDRVNDLDRRVKALETTSEKK